MALGLVAAALLAEGLARAYVYLVAEQGKLFQPDPEVGWTLIPDLDLTRKNVDGDRWHVRTNARGFRTLDDEFRPDARRRILIVGDSFAFGQGVSLEDRFDGIIAAAHPEWSIINQGVMGYGTDQELIAARDEVGRLRPGDLLLIVSYLNDFVDVLAHSRSGRAKPWFELASGELVAHPPELGFSERIRDRSYLLARLFQAFEDPSPEPTPAQLRTSGHLYRRIVEAETAEAIDRGVRVLIANHGAGTLDSASQRTLKRAAEDALTRLCESPGIACVSLDRAITHAQDQNLFQSDGHWNAAGNAVVAAMIEAALTRVLEP